MKEYKNPLLLSAAFKLYKRGHKLMATFFARLNNFYNSCSIPCNLSIGSDSVFMHSGKGCVIHERVKIGNNVRIFHNVTIGCKWSDNKLDEEYNPLISDNVMIGCGAVILGNVKIGKNSIIAANSVVTKDVEENVLVGGIPSKIIKRLDK